jgi:spermidine synthase
VDPSHGVGEPLAPPLSARALFPLYALFFVSGLAGLIYEVMWARSFGLVFGSTTRASAAVLAAFFAGMAVGNALGARWARRADRALRRYALLELLIGLSALLVPVWLAIYAGIYPNLYRSMWGSGKLLALVNLALALLALGPPCIAMGATLPLISQVFAARTQRADRTTTIAYALNTVGAAVGVVASGFFLPVWLGTRAAMYVAVGLNLFVAATACLMSRWDIPHDDKPRPAADEPVGIARNNLTLVAMAAVSGFGTLALEVLYTRLLVNATDSSVFSFATMLAVFLLCLALGALISAAAVSRSLNAWRWLALTQTIASLAIMLSPRFFTWLALRLSVPDLPAPMNYLVYLAALGAAVLGPAVLLVGMALPIVWRLAAGPGERLGRTIGRLTAVNTLGAVAGSLVAGFVIIPTVGVSRGFAIIAALYALLALGAWVRALRMPGGALAGAAGILAILLLHDLKVDRVLPIAHRSGERMLRYIDGEAASVAVLEKPNGERFLQVNNRYLLGSSGAQAAAVERSQGELPLALHPAPKRVAFVGVATGTSVSAILSHPVERVVAMELLPGVLVAADYFDAANLRVLEDPRVEVLVADGRNHLFAAEEHFDAIVGDLYVPWHAGTGYLYTVEYFRTVKARLAADGIFCQWLQSDQVTTAQLPILAGGFTDVFPNAQLWLLANAPGSPALIALVGWADDGAAGVAWTRAQELMRTNPRFAVVCNGGTLQTWAARAPRNTDNKPLIEFMAAAEAPGRAKEATADVLRTISKLRESAAGGTP